MTDYVTVRGCNVPAQEIQNLKDQFGAELVPDSEVLIIAALDIALKRYRAMHGHFPERVNLSEDPMHWYVYKVLSVREPVTGVMLPVYTKPAWFRVKRIFKAVTP